MKTEIGSYEAKTKLPELLRQVQKGKSFTITNRGKAVADLVPSENTQAASRAEAVKKMQEFIRTTGRIKGVNIKELIEEGRD
jgi:prevent-host-death family protein